MTEVRVVFAFVAIAVAYVGYTAIDQEDKTRATICVYGALLTAMLFVISGYSDLSEIFGSQNDNENLCGLKGKYKVPEMVKVVYYECTFARYYLGVMMSVACAGALVAVAYLIEKWKQGIPTKHN